MTAWAQDYLGKGLAEAQSPPTPEGFGLLSSLLSAAGALVLVLALIYSVFFVLRRWGQSRGWVLPSADKAIRVLGVKSLEGRKNLYLVQVGGSILVLSAGSSDLRLIHSVADPAEVARIRTDLGLGAEEEGTPFEGALSAAFEREGKSRGLKESGEAVARARQVLGKVFDRLGGKAKE
jgi:flagellar biogenesis protein FliO